MSVRRLFSAELVLCLCLVAFGIGVAAIGSTYSMGTVRNIGPGFFPVWLGILVAVLSSILAVGLLLKSASAPRSEEAPLPPIPWRAIFAITASLWVWTLLAERFGLALATFALGLVATLAERSSRFWPSVVMALILAAGSSIVFVLLLDLRLPIFMR